MGHTLRGAVSAWLALIVLQTVVANSGQASGALGTLNQLLQRALSPDVPAIPDRRAGAKPAADSGGWFHMTPAQVGAAHNLGVMAPVIKQATADPNNIISRLANLNLVGVGNLNTLNH